MGSILRQQRISLSLTLRELAAESGVSSSLLDRIELGERVPTAHVLKRIAGPLGFNESELFVLAGYLSHGSPPVVGNGPASNREQLDPWVATMLSQEPVEVQRAAIGILSILRILSRNVE